MLTSDFEARVRAELDAENVDVVVDPDVVIRIGSRIVRRQRVGWAMGGVGAVAVTVIALATLLRPTGAVPTVADPASRTSPTTVQSSPAVPDPVASLRGTAWEVVTLGGNALVPGSNISLRFTEETVGGFGGCIRYGYDEVEGEVHAGAYRTEGDQLHIEHLNPEYYGIACKPASVAAQQVRYQTTLMKVQRFELTATGLALLDGSGSELVTLTPAPVSLDSTSWVVKEFGYPETVPLRPVTLRFSGGTLSVQTGCGVLTGQYRQNTEQLVVTFDATALPACPTAELRRQQANLKKELTKVTGFQRDGSQIMLLSAEGVRVVKGALG